MTYPKWIQRTPDLGPILATSEEEEALFSGMGVDAEAEAAGTDAAETIHTLRAALDDAGISYDKRLGVDRLRALLPAN
jgi:hypothetical protein